MDEKINPKSKLLLILSKQQGEFLSNDPEFKIISNYGELIEIIPKEKYTSADLDWNDSKSRTSIECNDKKSRPEIANTINVENFDTSTANNIDYMFHNCYNLKSINVSNFRFRDNYNIRIRHMFSGCYSLTSIDFQNKLISIYSYNGISSSSS